MPPWRETRDHWAGSTHIELLGMRGVSDAAIWTHARDGNFIIVSKDDDFRSLALVRGPPPKVIWLQIGNASTAAVADLLRANARRGQTCVGVRAEPA
jgi:predicted nuclease of predicted toxin-antitoxin system